MAKAGYEIRNAIARKQASAVEVVEAALAHAQALEPQLHAYIRLLPDRDLAKAREIYELVKSKKTLVRLAGVPVAVKDIFCVAGEITTAGSKILENFRAPYSATVVEQLDHAGDAILCKTNM